VIFARIVGNKQKGPGVEFVALVGMSLTIGSASTSAFAITKRTEASAAADVRALVRMMDKDPEWHGIEGRVPAIWRDLRSGEGTGQIRRILYRGRVCDVLCPGPVVILNDEMATDRHRALQP
jgi:hypothetical protein